MTTKPNILLTRIDNRLIHGQVGVTWVNHLGANLVVVANDKVSQDEVQQSLMDMVLPDVIQARYFSIQKTIDIIHKASPKQKIFLVVKDVHDALALKQGGVPIDHINVGNMHYEEGKKQISSTVSVDDKDIEAFKKLADMGVTLDVRGVPNEKGQDIRALIKEFPI
ncbi:PTS N-acetylgalactosamine transporter subunit IIB [Virgibacillus pantothenticus]|nr:MULTISPECIES: PTS N-acetylgalactosamine transporter subunit IIB [Virgibacillus]MBS7427852.1 PTS N-acetylgalactosamine transporter subunit IIB [Virgibacillus sp. 19R1-5]MBU8566642.1 PTS N-acetylgalactosamine transporter subunit IIB [Virgibacillus pantothenticus]MBU8599133.1 PTS N-acetylgalactosamine transporter subunit IIB [Virgibacillus pantothenticus]MBU8634798.1 PTS N-acetylgalactosamine transporter subunit IIB [Virgibacillus pantothenticus]MBU8641119.1 PTS N-acetylgalactosamine transport